MGTTIANRLKRLVGIVFHLSYLIAVFVTTTCFGVSHFAPVVDLSDQATSKPISTHPIKHHATIAMGTWMMPANGPILMTYGPTHKGISIGGQLGDPIFAAASGEVVYAGDELKRYGNIIILKHDNQYLSAYAYNRKLLVKLGQYVNKGQVIAEMGASDANKALLYFEVRKNG